MHQPNTIVGHVSGVTGRLPEGCGYVQKDARRPPVAWNALRHWAAVLMIALSFALAGCTWTVAAPALPTPEEPLVPTPVLNVATACHGHPASGRPSNRRPVI